MPKDHGIIGLNDSKKLSPKKRLVLYKEIKIKSISIGMGLEDIHSIDKVNIRNAQYRNDQSLIDINNSNPISQKYTKGYLHHLFKTNEILGYRIATQHNLSFYNNLLAQAKDAIINENFDTWSKDFLKSYNE